MDEDIPLYIDPFLMWNSPKATYQHLHSQLIAFLERVRLTELAGKRLAAARLLAGTAEARELGLGYAQGSKRGSGIGQGLITSVLNLWHDVPQLSDHGLNHIEVIGLMVQYVSLDRISDLTASVLRRFFIDFTSERAKDIGLPTQRYRLDGVFDHERGVWGTLQAHLPFDPRDESPLLLAPLDLLRRLPWINYEDYYHSSFARLVLPPDASLRKVPKAQVLEYNRRNYVAVDRYVLDKERRGDECRPDPLFRPLQLSTLKSKLNKLLDLPTGRTDGADRDYEEILESLLSSLLYPELDLAESQVRTVGNTHVRDLIFYNDGKTPFLNDLRTRYQARQLVFELKNVQQLEGTHVNQLYRYLDDEMGQVGILVGRRPAPKKTQRNVVDLHSSHRHAIFWLEDRDLALMVELLESGRRPVEALKAAYVRFSRLLPK